jgi:Aminoglycoside N3''-acetyltransferase
MHDDGQTLMDEAGLIERTKNPATRESLRRDLEGMGIGAGDVVLVHCSLRSLGWVSGGPVAVIQALLDAVGIAGTIAMPAHSAGLTDPANWGQPPVPPAWIEIIRSSMPAYEPATTPTSNMGAVAEIFRTWPKARRSAHPATSMTAWGRQADEITARHDLADPLGPTSPSGALYRSNAKILLIGVGFNRCTALHLAEHIRWPDRPSVREGAPILVDGERQWVEFEVPQIMDDDEFLPVGDAALASGVAISGNVALAPCIIAGMPQLVDFAVDHWRAAKHPATPR